MNKAAFFITGDELAVQAVPFNMMFAFFDTT